MRVAVPAVHDHVEDRVGEPPVQRTAEVPLREHDRLRVTAAVEHGRDEAVLAQAPRVARADALALRLILIRSPAIPAGNGSGYLAMEISKPISTSGQSTTATTAETTRPTVLRLSK